MKHNHNSVSVEDASLLGYAVSIFRVPGILSSRKMVIIRKGKYKGEDWSSKKIKWRFCPVGETTGATCGDFKGSEQNIRCKGGEGSAEGPADTCLMALCGVNFATSKSVKIIYSHIMTNTNTCELISKVYYVL
jgi:hypothetical protein